MSLLSRILMLSMCSLALVIFAFANQKDDEAADLLKRARDLSDMRVEGAPPFVLKANLKLTNDDGSILNGTYTEYWNSKAQWRREFAFGDFRRIQVAVEQKVWLLGSSKNSPGYVLAFRTPFDVWVPRSTSKVSKFKDGSIDGVPARCFETKASPIGASEFCFDKSTGTLMEAQFPVGVNGIFVNSSCAYRNYKKFGEHWVPTSSQCLQDGKGRIEAELAELTLRPEFGQDLFIPPLGAKESSRCTTHVKPPKPIYQVDPEFAGEGEVTVSLTVGSDGMPRDLKVVNSPKASMEKAALQAVSQWRFAPATCDGEPFEVEIAVEVMMHRVY